MNFIKGHGLVIIQNPNQEFMEASQRCESGQDDGSEFDELARRHPMLATMLLEVFGDNAYAPVFDNGKIEIVEVW